MLVTVYTMTGENKPTYHICFSAGETIDLGKRPFSPQVRPLTCEEAFLQRPFHMGVLGVLSLFKSIWIFPFYHKNCLKQKTEIK